MKTFEFWRSSIIQVVKNEIIKNKIFAINLITKQAIKDRPQDKISFENLQKALKIKIKGKEVKCYDYRINTKLRAKMQYK